LYSASNHRLFSVETTANQRLLLDQIASDLSFKSKDDFYHLSIQVPFISFKFNLHKEIKKRGLAKALKQYQHPSTLLSTVYPEHVWLPWKFDKCPHSYWEDLNNQRKFLDWMGKQLNFKEFSDWYSVTYKVLNKENCV
jgi:hypothetical protein